MLEDENIRMRINGQAIEAVDILLRHCRAIVPPKTFWPVVPLKRVLIDNKSLRPIAEPRLLSQQFHDPGGSLVFAEDADQPIFVGHRSVRRMRERKPCS